MRPKRIRLNAPYGAWCLLTLKTLTKLLNSAPRLNAPYGALCFVPGMRRVTRVLTLRRLNTPCGAQCILTLSDFP